MGSTEGLSVIKTDPVKLKNHFFSIYEQAYRGKQSKFGYKRKKDLQNYLRWLFTYSDGFFMAFVGNTPAGFLICDTDWKDKKLKLKVGEIHEVAVSKKFQGMGIGHALVETALEHIKSLGLAIAGLWVARENKHAWMFYLKHGFIPGESDGFWIRMRKVLNEEKLKEELNLLALKNRTISQT